MSLETAYDFFLLFKSFFSLHLISNTLDTNPFLHLGMLKYKTKHIVKDEVMFSYLQVLEGAI